MLIIGITGSIASGKTFVSELIGKKFNAPIFNADKENEKILREIEVINEVGLIFPEVVHDGIVNKAKLGEIVFGDKEKLKMLERTLHPRITKSRREFIKNTMAKMAILDIPLLFENGIDKECDFTILVKSDDETRLVRYLSRLNSYEKKFHKINKTQMRQEEKAKLANFVIENDSGDLNLQIERIFNKINEIKNAKNFRSDR